jgi:hypothetical protein
MHTQNFLIALVIGDMFGRRASDKEISARFDFHTVPSDCLQNVTDSLTRCLAAFPLSSRPSAALDAETIACVQAFATDLPCLWADDHLLTPDLQIRLLTTLPAIQAQLGDLPSPDAYVGLVCRLLEADPIDDRVPAIECLFASPAFCAAALEPDALCRLTGAAARHASHPLVRDIIERGASAPKFADAARERLGSFDRALEHFIAIGSEQALVEQNGVATVAEIFGRAVGHEVARPEFFRILNRMLWLSDGEFVQRVYRVLLFPRGGRQKCDATALGGLRELFLVEECGV